MPLGDIIGGVIGGAGSLIGGNKQASDQKAAANKAASTARLGFDYLQGSPIGQQYLPAGGAANAQIAELLGVGGGAGGYGGSSGAPDEAATLAKIKQGLQAWNSKSPGADSGIIKMIDSGAPLSSVSSALNSLQASTTHPTNTAFLDPIVEQAANPIRTQAGGTNGAGGSAGDGLTGNNAFNKYLDSTGYKFQLGQGQQAITTSNAARGLLNSGATLKALTKYGQNLASTTFNQYLNQLGGLSNSGLQAGTAIGNAGDQAGSTGANAIAQGYGNAASSKAEGTGGLFGSLAKIAPLALSFL